MLFGKRADTPADLLLLGGASSDTKALLVLVLCLKPLDQPANPPKPPSFDLDLEQTKKYDALVKHFESYKDKPIPVAEGSTETLPLVAEELAWLTKECFLRYLRATKWNLDQAIERIELTIAWRRTYGVTLLPGRPSPLTPELISPENETGKQIILGYDNDSRPCLYLRTGYQNTQPSQRQVQHLVFMLERVIQFMPPGQDTLALLIDFAPAPAHMKLSLKFPGVAVTRDCMHVLQHHYPERLGKGLFTNVPWVGHLFFKMALPFIDPYTRLKTIFDGNFADWVPSEQLDKQWGGLLDFDYNHNVYWPALNEMAEQKRALYMSNFERLGQQIGLSEYDLRMAA